MPSTVRRTALPGWSRSPHDQMARGLGYVSIALGIGELLRPRALCRATGLDGRETLLRAYGAREIATGIAILASHDATPWMWARVAGDAADLAALATAAPRRGKPRTLLSLAALAGVTALDAICAIALTAEKGGRHTARADYRDRSGFPRGLEAARGAARHSAAPRDMRIPDRLRPATIQNGADTRLRATKSSERRGERSGA